MNDALFEMPMSETARKLTESADALIADITAAGKMTPDRQFVASMLLLVVDQLTRPGTPAYSIGGLTREARDLFERLVTGLDVGDAGDDLVDELAEIPQQ